MLLCESCLAIVDHVMTDLKKKVGSHTCRFAESAGCLAHDTAAFSPRCISQGKVKNQEVAITGLLDDVCDQSNMKRFKFIPPKMVCSSCCCCGRCSWFC